MIQTKYVTTVTVTDPDSGLPVEVEIRKLETGPMVGIDGSFLEQLADDEQPFSPYDDDNGRVVPIIIPDNET